METVEMEKSENTPFIVKRTDEPWLINIPKRKTRLMRNPILAEYKPTFPTLSLFLINNNR